MVDKITKRDGRTVDFDILKIADAVHKATIAVGKEDRAFSKRIADRVYKVLDKEDAEAPTVEYIQDLVERALIDSKAAEVAKEYITYRYKRNVIRDRNNELMSSLKDLTFKDSKDNDLKRENANIDGDTTMGTMLRFGSETSKYFCRTFLFSPGIMKAHSDGYIHIHDLDFAPMGCTTCTQHDLTKLFDGGFSTGHGYIREPGSIRSYASLACIAIQSNQNEQHGGQSIAKFDYDLAKGVSKTYIKTICHLLQDRYDYPKEDATKLKDRLFLKYIDPYTGIDASNISEDVLSVLKSIGHEQDFDRFMDIVLRKTDKETFESMEALVHNLCSMHARAGAQIPFSSINFGTDTSWEGRMVSKNLLLAVDAGLGSGETPIFPITIFKCKKGVSFEPGDPNYDLFQLACRVSAKRLFPNFCFLDSPFNLKYYKEGHPETEVVYMGCRTRVIGNVYDPEREVATGRGNLSFTSINLPRLAIESGGDIVLFREKLDEYMELCFKQLEERFKIQSGKKVYNFPFLMGQGIWLDSDKLDRTDIVGEVLKHGTLSVGFIGLAEALYALCGKHHGEDKGVYDIGLGMIAYMREKCDKKSKETGLNYTLLGTPAEGLSGRFVRMDRKLYGNIEGVTDKEYYTNSFHIPVSYPITAYKKIELEAPFHALCNAGHITYVEIDGDPLKNLRAFEDIVRYMGECGVGYGAINHPVDFCTVCGYSGIIDEECPVCGRKDGESVPIDRLVEIHHKYPTLVQPPHIAKTIRRYERQIADMKK